MYSHTRRPQYRISWVGLFRDHWEARLSLRGSRVNHLGELLLSDLAKVCE